MKRESIITIKRVLNVTDLAGEKVMVDFENGKYFMIKGVGNDIWDMLKEETTPARIIEKLLSDPTLSLREISEIMGFNNEYYFSTFFKKHGGSPPGEYRRMIGM